MKKWTMITILEEPLQSISQILVQEHHLEKEKALLYQQAAARDKRSLVQYLVENHILSARTIALLLARNVGLPILDLECIDLESVPATLINEQLIRRTRIVPIATQGDHLYVATDDPYMQSSLKEIQFHTGLHVSPVVVETDKLNHFIDQLLHKKEKQGLADYFGIAKDTTHLEHGASMDSRNHDSKEDAPIIKFVNSIIMEAIKKGVSDIHFEPYELSYRIRYRQDGLLHEVATPPIHLAARIASRIKIMANIDISERRIPQDGRFNMKLSQKRPIDFRVSSCPTVSGEKIVVRILDPTAFKLSIESLGFSAQSKSQFIHAINRPQGMVLVTGPTGSGKTATLYAAINSLNTIERNISTAEDPVEINLAGINQVNIHPKAGLTFPVALRAFLRQDPDIIMLGEIRDLETAEIAVKAAQTGHLVLSTLHTNSAAETLTRLIGMGVPSFHIASTTSLIIAQRLVRQLCNHCKVVHEAMNAMRWHEMGFGEHQGNLTIYKATGCNQCTNGYRGRIGLFEVMPITKDIGQIILSGGTSLDILKQAQREGMLTIHQAGLNKIKEGITTIEEVNRVTVD